MRRHAFWSALVICAALAVSSVRADVRTQERTIVKFEGFMGGLMNRAAGGDKGITSTVAVKGNRMSRMNDSSGQIVDLAEEKIYHVDVRKKEYSVLTFAEMRQQIEEARARLAKQQQDATPQEKQDVQEVAQQLDFDVDVKETGQRKTLAGHDVREVVLAITMRQRGKTLEEGGGMVMTSTMWLAPRIAALDELNEFNIRYFKAVYAGAFSGVDGQQLNALRAMMPGIASLSERMAGEQRKLQGTSLASTTVFEGVKSPEQMQNAEAQQPSSSGLSGMLARRMMGGRGQTQQRTTAMTTSTETLSIAAAASDADVAIPAGFKLKK